jgi:hypothetical protein
MLLMNGRALEKRVLGRSLLVIQGLSSIDPSAAISFDPPRINVFATPRDLYVWLARHRGHSQG